MTKVVKLLKGHHSLLHRIEHFGNLLILSSVSFGVHEVEVLVSSGLAMFLVVVLLVGDDA